MELGKKHKLFWIKGSNDIFELKTSEFCSIFLKKFFGKGWGFELVNFEYKSRILFLPHFKLLTLIGPENMELIKIADCCCFYNSERTTSMTSDSYFLEGLGTSQCSLAKSYTNTKGLTNAHWQTLEHQSVWFLGSPFAIDSILLSTPSTFNHHLLLLMKVVPINCIKFGKYI